MYQPAVRGQEFSCLNTLGQSQFCGPFAMGLVDAETVHRIQRLMDDMGLRPGSRAVVQPARDAAAAGEEKGKGNDGVFAGAAVELPDGSIITGSNSPLLHATASLVLRPGPGRRQGTASALSGPALA